jgi:hypothetical protein
MDRHEAVSKAMAYWLTEGGHSCPPLNGGLENPPSVKNEVYQE